MKENFYVTGMSCSSCASHVENAVKNLNGVSYVNVNLLSNSMTVEYDADSLSTTDIIAAVSKAGYGASVMHDDKKADYKKKINNTVKSFKKRVIISFIFLIPLIYLAMHHEFNVWFGLPVPQFIKTIFHGTENAFRYSLTQLILLIPIVIFNIQYFKNGFKHLIKKTPNMDSLIALGSFTAIAYSLFSTIRIWYGLHVQDVSMIEKYSMELYFETAGTILTLITLGKYFELKSKRRTNNAIEKLIDLTPKTAIIFKAGNEQQILVENIQVDDVIVIKPGNIIPVDGIIIEGNSSVDESTITGESMPIWKGTNDNVTSGTINKTGAFKFKVTKIGKDTTLAQIIALVEEASNSKAPISKIADKISGIFVPIVIVIAILSTIIWLLLGQNIEFALSIGIAVLVISCPCALGLATPLAIMIGIGKGAENGILIKSADILELGNSIDTIVFDKTGTITNGTPIVTDIHTFNEISELELLTIAGSLEQNSEHPLAEAILKKLKETNLNTKSITDFNSIPGMGIKGKIDNKVYFGGNLQFMTQNNINLDIVKEFNYLYETEGKTIIYFSNNSDIIGIIAVADTIKADTSAAINELKAMNINIVMLTGDNTITANAIGKKLNIQNVIAEVLPKDKENTIKTLQSQGKKVAMVGDGINDSPALSRADIGIAIGTGTDIAIESADVILVKNNLLDLISFIKLSKLVIKTIRVNLFWAFFYNIIGIPIAAGLLYSIFNLKLNPMIAAASMSLSSLCVVANSLRIKFFNKSKSN